MNGPWVRAKRLTRSASGSSTALGEGVGYAGWHGDAEPVAQPADVLDRRPALVSGHPDGDQPSAVGEGGEPLDDVAAVDAPVLDLVGAERAEPAHQVGNALGVADAALGVGALEHRLDLGQHLRVEQLTQLGPPEELGEQPLVEGQRGGPAFGDGGVALVDELRDVPEQQAAGVRRGLVGVDVVDADLAALDPAHQPDERGQVVDVLEALAHGLEHDRERGVLDRDLEQRGTPLALLPQRRPATGVAAREQECPGGALAEAGREQRGTADLLGDQVVDLVGLERDHLAASGGSASVSGMRITMPSSEAIAWPSTPYRSRSRALIASAQGAWTGVP